MALIFQKPVLPKKYQDMLIEGPGIFQATGVPGAKNHAMFRAGDTRAHILAALERIVELPVHDQHRHFQFGQSRRQIAILQCVEYLGDGGRAQAGIHLGVHAEQILAPSALRKILADKIAQMLNMKFCL